MPFTAIIAAACTEANRPPHAITLAKPADPPAAVKARLRGNVEVLIRLADDGTVRLATAAKGPEPLRASAEDAARRSTFEPEYRACAHHGGLYTFVVEYDYTADRPSSAPTR